MVGILATPAFAATSGTVRRQGPHQGAENKTNTGRASSPPRRTSDSNCSVVKIIRPPDFAIMERPDALCSRLAGLDPATHFGTAVNLEIFGDGVKKALAVSWKVNTNATALAKMAFGAENVLRFRR
ncbi:hypothetical protein ACHAXS_014327 [Conticribra weissflogii]